MLIAPPPNRVEWRKPAISFVEQEHFLTPMLGILAKKRITDAQVANLFVNATLEAVEKGWPVVAQYIQDCPEFVIRPEIDDQDFGKFLMVVVSANFEYIPAYFDADHDREIIRLCIVKFAHVFDIEPEKFACKIKEYRSLLKRINAPSKNPLYSMAKGIFSKYELNEYQEEYFRTLKSPNPIFLKNMDDLMKNFIWDWENFRAKYKVKDLV